MHRCKIALILAILLTIAVTTILAASAPEAQAATLKSRLAAAKHSLSAAKAHLAQAQTALATAVAGLPAAAAPSPSPSPGSAVTPTADPSSSATPTPDVTSSATPAPVDPALLAALQATVRSAQQKVKSYAALVSRLAAALRRENQLALWERTGNWYPLVRALAAPYHVNARSLYRMLMLESGGRRYARGGGGRFLGLFQYYPGTWRGHWNPWRTASIYNARAQILATAFAIRHGHGPSWWPHTYRMAF